MKAAKLGLRWFQAVLKRISWVSLLTGLAVGVPLWWTVKAITGSGHMGPGVELAVGVALGALGGWAVPEFVDYVRRLTKTSRPLTQVIGELASNALFPKDPSVFLKRSPGLPGNAMQVLPKHSLPWTYVENDARALAYSMAVLAAAGKHRNLSIVRDDESLNIQSGNFVCIGSSKSNLKTKQLFDSWKDSPIAFTWCNNSTLILRSNLSEDFWEAKGGFDYGLVLKVRDDISGSCLMVLAGISHVGTGAAGWYLWRNWQTLAEEFGDSQFAVVLQVDENYHQICKSIFKAKQSESRGWQVTR